MTKTPVLPTPAEQCVIVGPSSDGDPVIISGVGDDSDVDEEKVSAGRSRK